MGRVTIIGSFDTKENDNHYVFSFEMEFEEVQRMPREHYLQLLVIAMPEAELSTMTDSEIEKVVLGKLEGVGCLGIKIKRNSKK